jgi:diguanylate cyclase (GGDEF)-like protein
MTSSSLYPVLSTGLVLILIFFNYIRKVDTDKFQRKVYLSVLVTLFIAIIANFAASVLYGRSGNAVHVLLYIINILYFLFQNLSYYLVAVFIDYLSNKNTFRIKKFIYIVLGIMGINILVMALNIFFGFYFSISQDNQFIDGTMPLIHFCLSYTAILMVIVDLLVSSRYIKASQIYIVVIFSVLIGAGGALDLIYSGGNIIWAFLTAGMLFSYFYILRSDTSQDSITGIGNRSSFNEFVNQIIRMKDKQSYTVAQFDINGLKKINTKYGIESGDKALADLAMILKKCSRQSDFVARLGDDDFIVAINAKYNMDLLTQKVVNELDNYNKNKKDDKDFKLEISHGKATFITKADQTVDEFLRELRDKVYEHKRNQKGEEVTIHAR